MPLENVNMMGEHLMKRTFQMWRDNMLSFFCFQCVCLCHMSLLRKKRRKKKSKSKKTTTSSGRRNLQHIDLLLFEV
jgi:hypothetical protein